MEADPALAPDVCVVVEGESDAVYFRAFTRMFLNDRDVVVAVEARNGKTDVERRVRDLIRSDRTLAVIAVLDADAIDEERTLRRLDAPYVRIYRYPSGEIEDKFDAMVHAETLNTMYPNGESIRADELSTPFVHSMRKILYARKSAAFDKRRHAEALIGLIRSTDQIPMQLRTIVEDAINVGKKHRTEFPPAASAITIDRRTRSFVLKLLEKTDLVLTP